MSRTLGEPQNDYVIMAEGNTSARASEQTFWVKASGFCLHQIQPEGFIELNAQPVLDLLKGGPEAAGKDFSQTLLSACVNPAQKARPSIEAGMHAMIYALCGANFIGHTHPSLVNALLCARDAQKLVMGRLFPEQVVFCGAIPAFIPYVEPGLPLALSVKQALEAHLDHYGTAPKTIFMQNHGLIALAQTAAEVESITAMTVKSCRVLQGTAAFGGPNFMTAEQVRGIDSHPSELYRRNLAGF